MQLLWLGQLGANETALVGGKAANLSQLAAAYRVPNGFCLTTAAFNAAANNTTDTLPQSIYNQLSDAYRLLAAESGVAEPSVAVRSSAVDEDGGADSFAGQHETYLNITGVDAVAAAVRHCWESARAERVLEYRRLRGLATDRVSLAVLIQHQVASDVSAVVFSANPLTSNRGQVVVNASWGLGESIVGGTVTPDTYTIRSFDMSIASRQIATKRRMTIAVAGGSREVDVPRILHNRPSLSDAQAIEMAQLAVSLETYMGWPVDVECAYERGTLYLLQCRPITTLETISQPHSSITLVAA